MKLKTNKTTIILAIIFTITIIIRLIIAFQTTEATHDAYHTLRQIDNIKNTGIPLYTDDLSYSGRENVFSPLYYYILSFFSLIIPPIIAIKIIPNILAATTIFIVYKLSKRLSKNTSASLIAAGASAIIPVYFSNTINNASIYSIVIPLFFLTIYYFLETITNSKNLWKLITCLFIFSLTHATSLILSFALLLYVVLLKIQGFKKSTKEPEMLLFTVLLVLWTNLIIYKQAIMMHGSAIIYQNTPIQIILECFKEITFVESLYWIGTIPLLFGVITIYDSVFGSRKKTATALIAICVTFFILLWFRLINVYVGLMFLGVTVTILSSSTIAKTLEYAKNIKIKYAKPITKYIIITLIILSFIPTISYSIQEATNTPTKQDIKAYEWLKNNTEEDAIILTFPHEGSTMSYYAERKNVIDQNYLLINNIDTRYQEAKKIYTDRFLIPALTKLNYYTTDYIVLTENAREEIPELAYEDDECIKKEYYTNQTKKPKIYSVNCQISLQ